MIRISCNSYNIKRLIHDTNQAMKKMFFCYTCHSKISKPQNHVRDFFVATIVKKCLVCTIAFIHEKFIK